MDNNNKVEQIEKPIKNDKPQKPVAVSGANAIDGISQIRAILMGDFVSRWENKISRMEHGVKELIHATESKLAAMENKMATLDKELKEELETNLLEFEQENDDLRNMLQSFKDELEEKIKSLNENKMDRDSIAEVFIQWGQKVKGAQPS